MARFYLNDQVRPLDAPPSRAPLAFHRKLPGYAPTPLLDATELAAEIGVGRLWIKDESSRLGLPSFKILGASWGVYRAIERYAGGLAAWSSLEELTPQLERLRPLSLAAATDGNHGRAVARMARLLGFGARIFVPEGTSPARIAAIESEGASCDVVEGTYDDAVTRSAKEASEDCLVISDTSWPGYEDVPRWVIEGYATIFWEIEDAIEGAADLVTIQLGVGAMGAAAVRHFRRPGAPPTRMLGVEPDRAACVLASMEAGEVITIPGPHDSIMAGLNCGTPSIVAWPWVSSGYDAFVAIDDERAREGMRAFDRAGVVAGETGAAGFGGLAAALDDREARERLGLGPGASVLLLCTEGATDPAAYERIVGHPPRVR
ncbi:MAG TPA: diaminopropionate ammonia-lyase [Actinomycetota bacterium]|nr:diaminopropionate ammonia-lyase [Actinomycetota bacterium]